MAISNKLDYTEENIHNFRNSNRFKSKSYYTFFHSVVHVESCHQPGRISLTTQSGLLSNVITGENQCGANTRPWYIRASEGQQIKFTLEDFHVQDQAPTTCNLYAVITGALIFNKECGRQFMQKISLPDSKRSCHVL